MLKFDYIVGHRWMQRGELIDLLTKNGANGYRFVQMVDGMPLLERISDPDEEKVPAPAVERITPQGEGIDEYLCGCSCGTTIGVPAKMRDAIVRDHLVPFAAGHGPRPEERTTYLFQK